MDERREQLKAAMLGIAGGDRQALALVYRMTSAKLFGTIVRIVRDQERAEDVLQDVYVKIWRRAGRFDPTKGTAIAWLCTVARNAAIDEKRRGGNGRELAGDELPEVEDLDATPADQWLCAIEENEALQKCLDTLSVDQRTSIKAAFFDGLTHSELALRVRVPLGTMKSWIRRGLATLKGCLSG